VVDSTTVSATLPAGRGGLTRISERELGPSPARSNGFHPIRIKEIVPETADAVSVVFDVPPAKLTQFRYQAGQFLTVRVEVNGAQHQRCYSMSSSPAVREDLRITVKRDPGGLVSTWINDTAKVGDDIDVSTPAGAFLLDGSGRDVVAFAGGSGITPVFSLIRTALLATARRVRLFYASRDRNSVIFGQALDELAQQYPDRFVLRHHLDEALGVVHAKEVTAFAPPTADADFYICGPGPFMDTVQGVLLRQHIDPERLHLERFQVNELAVGEWPESPTTTEEVTIRLNRRRTKVAYRTGNTLLQTARLAGLRVPSSCEIGSCGTCMARIVEGSVRMLNNDALTENEVAEGWVLTCQSIPTSPTIDVGYE
jgi:3-ketosteroid 9alpha-monooxygenase subunit B